MVEEVQQAQVLVTLGEDKKALKKLWVVEAGARNNLGEARALKELASEIAARTSKGLQQEALQLVQLAEAYVGGLEAGSAPPSPVSSSGAPRVGFAGKAVEATYSDCSAARLYSAGVRTVTELGCLIINSDSVATTLSFRTGMSMKSWQGQEMTATVSSDPPNAAKIVIGGKRVTRGAQLQVYDWGEGKAIARKFLDRLTPVVAATPEPTSAARTSAARESVSIAEELKRIALLHEQGVLTDEEFAAAKAKLLT